MGSNNTTKGLDSLIDDGECNSDNKFEVERVKEEMGAITSAVIAVVGVLLGWITIEIACKPCLQQARQAIDRNLNPDYDPDDDDATAIRAPLNPAPTAASSAAVKAV